MAINNTTKGSVSLRFWHPTKDLTFLSPLLGLASHRNWLAGTNRKTPKGSPLPGLHKESYWVTRLEFFAKEGFFDKFELAINHFIKVEQELSSLIESGGKAELYLQLPGNLNNGGTIESKYCLILGELGVNLLIEVFP